MDTNKVQIGLTAYPQEEFGVLEGRISSISKIPVEDQYEAIVTLTNGFLTSFGKEIEFMIGMEGEAEIILEDERLMLRVFKNLRQ